MEPIRIAVMFFVLVGAFIQRERLKRQAPPPRYWRMQEPARRDSLHVDTVRTYTTTFER
jgi:hypothetical protein